LARIIAKERNVAETIDTKGAQSLVYSDRAGEHPYFGSVRTDILALVPVDATRILDVGCGMGRLGQALKAERGRFVAGIELHAASAAMAAGVLDQVICASVSDVRLDELGQPASYDCIIFGDILEHLLEPWETLRRFAALLTPSGVVVASIPNIGHVSIIWGLLRGRWEYGERGLLDRTHLRFFTYRSIHALVQQAGMEIVRCKPNFRLVERDRRYARVARLLGKGPLKSLFAYQYVIVARRRESNTDGVNTRE
jgi:2-polyprenyl-3-methyl-5-hydroxy-6-metoxy-1,4-benzoquinol methylase